MKKVLTHSLAVLAMGVAVMAPSLAGAQNWHRQEQKDQWKDLAIGSAALGLIGALSHNDTLTGLGAAGALYSAYRYEADGSCYGRVYDRNDRRFEWVRVPDRDRDHSDNGNHYGWNRHDRGWNRNREDGTWTTDRDNRGRDGAWRR